MFSSRKETEKNRLALASLRPDQRRPDNGFHPRVEALEDRALPSLTLLSFNVPVVAVISETTFNFSFVLRIDLYSPTFSAASQAGTPRDASNAAARIASASQSVISQPAVSQPTASQASVNTPLTAASQDSAVAAASSRANSVLAAPAANSETASLLAFTNFPSLAPARPVVVKPSSPEGQQSPLIGLIASAEQPTAASAPVLPLLTNPTPPETRLAQPQLPVQAIGNRMEFIGSAAGVIDNAADNDKPSESTGPQPADPAPIDPEEIAPLGGMLGLPLSEAVLADHSWAPDTMDLGTLCGQTAEERIVLTPELATEVAVLAACVGGLPVGPRTPARRGDDGKRRLDIGV